jgi:hypothetical protein
VATKEVLQQTLRETAVMLGLQLSSDDEEGDAWFLVFDENTMFNIQHAASQQRIVIVGGIAEVPEAARVRVYEVLLQYNSMWAETGGVRTALDGLPGQAIMMLELSDDGLTPIRLAAVLANMADIQRAWRRILLAADDGALLEQAEQDGLASTLMLRV